MTRPNTYRPDDRRGQGIFRRSQKIRIKKRWRSFNERRSAGQVLEDWVGQFATWWRCMFDPDCPVYRWEFPAACWGEMGEYGVRFSTFYGILLIALGIAGFWLLFDSRMSWWFVVRIGIFVAMIIFGIRQFADLQGPIWWADRWAVKQVQSYYATGECAHYERRSEAMARLRPERGKLLLKPHEIYRLAELYHQFCVGTLSTQSWYELGNYTKAEVADFYKLFSISESDRRFPEEYLKPDQPQQQS